MPRKTNEVIITENNLFELQKLEYKESLYSFYLDAVKVHKPGTTFQSNWHIEYICDRLQAEAIRVWKKEKREGNSKHFIIGVPPRSTKSVVISILYPVWVWTFYPECKFITCTYSPTLAEEFATYSRDIILSDWYQKYFGDVYQLKDDSNSKNHYKNNRGGERLAKGRTGVTGHGGDINILDDSNDPQKIGSAAELKDGTSFYSDVFSNRLDQPDTSFMVVAGQRTAENDTIGYILENYADEFEHICIPAELSDKVSPPALAANYIDGLYFPERFSTKVLDGEKRKGLKYYATQYQQEPAPSGGIVFKPEYLPVITKEEYAAFKVDNKVKSVYNIFVDSAIKTEEKHDFTAIVVSQYHNGIYYIVDTRRIKQNSNGIATYLIDKIFPLYLKPDSSVWVEDKANGPDVINNLKLKGVYAKPLSTKNRPKQERAESILHIVEGNGVKIVKHNSVFENIPSNEQLLIDQLTMFPLAKNDDLVDAFVYALATKSFSKTYYTKVKPRY